MVKYIKWGWLGLFLTPVLAYADSSLGGLASNLMSPVGVFSGFISSACLLIGGAFVFASLIKYFEHRRQPLMVPISTVVFLLIAGLVLILLPLIYHWTQNGVPFWAWK
jgi:hypothetical protein